MPYDSAPLVGVNGASQGSPRPEFLTIAMWFAWLLRSDVRGTAAVEDEEAQRDFVCWWLCFGEAEYPAVWWYGPRQLEVALEPVGTGAARLPRLLQFVVRCRLDLSESYIRSGQLDETGLLCWYRISGPSELSAAPALSQELLDRTEWACRTPPWNDDGTEVSCMAVELWKRTPHLQRAWPAHDRSARAALQRWYGSAGAQMLPRPSIRPAGPEPLPPPAAPYSSGAEFGVNLVGYARGELGIGEDVRMLSASLAHAGIPHVVVDVPFGPAARREDHSVDGRIEKDLVYPITIYCLTAFDTADLFLRAGPEMFRTAYRIGNWPWELPRLPATWADAYALVDEVWAASRYAYDSYRASDGAKAVRLMLPAVVVDKPRATDWRRRILTRPDAFVFVVPFDPHSSFRRKNPIAAVLAFRRAFAPGDDSVALLLRINGDPAGRPGWAELEEAIASDPRIYAMTATLDRAEALGIVHSSDCLVSPHRAEGFGRNIAEAKLLGTPVLATGFSGNVDFTAPGESIRWSRAELQPGDYPHADGLWWAEPSVEDLAAKMAGVRGDGRRGPLARRKLSTGGINGVRDAGKGYAARLLDLAGELRLTGGGGGSVGRRASAGARREARHLDVR